VVKNWGKLVSEYGQIAKIRLSGGREYEAVPMSMTIGYCRRAFKFF